MENLNMSEYDRSPRSLWGSNQPYECLRCGATTMGENIERETAKSNVSYADTEF